MTLRPEGGFQPQPKPGQEGVLPLTLPPGGIPITTSDARYRPIVGEIDATGCGAFITYRSDDLLSKVTFTIRPNPSAPRKPEWDGIIVVYADGRMEVTGVGRDDNMDGVHFTLSDLGEMRRFTAIITWCYREAYGKVFYIRNVDQIPFK